MRNLGALAAKIGPAVAEDAHGLRTPRAGQPPGRSQRGQAFQTLRVLRELTADGTDVHRSAPDRRTEPLVEEVLQDRQLVVGEIQSRPREDHGEARD